MLKPNLRLKNSVFSVKNSEVLANEQNTDITATLTGGSSTTLTVQNITGFAVNDYIVLGGIGQEKTEIVQVHSATSPSGSTITLTGAVTYDHPTGTPVYRVSFNQAEFSRATTSGGSKSILTTIALSVDEEYTIYNDTTNTTGYGYVRFKNSTGTTYSQYSDEQAYSSIAFNSVLKIIDRVFSKSNEKKEGFITRTEILDYIWDFIDDVNDKRTQWKHEEADEDTSNSLTIGGEELTMPTNIKYPNEKSITDIRVSGYEPLKFISIREWAEKIAGLARTTLNGAVLSGATTIDLIDGANFSSSGDGYIAGDAFSWTGKSTNQLTGVTGVLAHATGLVVYQDSGLGLPLYYTVQNETIKIHPSPESTYSGFPVIIDYYKRLTHPDSENDLLPLPYVSPCITYCLLSVADKKGKDGLAEAQKYESRYNRQITQVIRNERTNKGSVWSSKE